MYRYKFLLSPSRVKSDIVFSEYSDLIMEAVSIINNGITFKRDGKSIHINKEDITNKEIIVELLSKQALSNPARSLSSLTRYLTSNYSEVFDCYVYNKSLFNMVLLTQENSSNLCDGIESKEELLKYLIDIIYSYPNTKEKNEAIEAIKNIVRSFLQANEW